MTRIAILGAGSFGTAMAVLYADAGHDVQLWARRPELVAELEAARASPLYLPGVPFPPNLRLTSDLAALVDAEILILAAPSHGYREVLHRFLPLSREGQPLVVVSSTKGIETD